MARPHESCALTQASLYPNRNIPPRPSSDSEAIRNRFLSSALRLVWGKHYFYRSPARFARLAWDFANNIGRQSQILSLLGAPVFASVIRQDPIFLFKYLTRDYLARGLSSRARAESFLRHYRRLRDVLPRPVLSGILHSRVVLLEKESDDHVFQVRLGRAHEELKEGELVLALEVDGKPTYILQFTIAPGWVVQSQAPEVFLISRLQGMKGCYSEVRLASKAFYEVAPPALLLAALHGFAQIFGVEEMAGIAASSQLCYSSEDAQMFKAAYDDYWLELGATRTSDSFFACPMPPPEKSLDGIKNGHKSRTRKKREFKRRIAEEVFHRLLGTEPELLRSAVDEAGLVGQLFGK
jgi:uncharacterized protein